MHHRVRLPRAKHNSVLYRLIEVPSGEVSSNVLTVLTVLEPLDIVSLEDTVPAADIVDKNLGALVEVRLHLHVHINSIVVPAETRADISITAESQVQSQLKL